MMNMELTRELLCELNRFALESYKITLNLDARIAKLEKLQSIDTHTALINSRSEYRIESFSSVDFEFEEGAITWYVAALITDVEANCLAYTKGSYLEEPYETLIKEIAGYNSDDLTNLISNLIKVVNLALDDLKKTLELEDVSLIYSEGIKKPIFPNL